MKYTPSSSYVAQGASSAIPKMVQKRRTFHVFGFMASLMLILSLLSAGGVIFYKKELEKQLVEAKSELNSKSTSENEKKIVEIGSFHTKLKTAELLLENHTAPSRLFAELEKITKKSVQFSSLTYSYDPGFEVTVELKAETDGLVSVALQKMKLVEDSLFSVFTVEGISSSLDTSDTEGQLPRDNGKQGISFGIKGLLRDDVVAYQGEKSTESPIPNAPPVPDIQSEEFGLDTQVDSDVDAIEDESITNEINQ